MKFTQWECHIISQVLGIQKAAVISDIEKILELRGKFDLSLTETEKQVTFPDKTDDEDESIHKDSEEVSVNKSDLQMIKNFLTNGATLLPVRIESVYLKNKIENKIKGLEDV